MVSEPPVADGDEVELKLIAKDPEALDDLAGRATLGPARLGPATTADELDRYLDTPDGRLSAARWACRLRTRDGRTIVSLKGPRGATPGHDASLHRRPEREGPADDRADPAQWPPSPARDLLAQLAAGMPLTERLTLVQQRTERPVMVNEVRVGTLSLDRVTVMHAGQSVGHLLAVELELSGDGAADETLVSTLSAALASVPGLTPDPTTKLEHALHLVAGASRREAPGPPAE